jgi:DNA-directed RNA polymerase subunit M/transcription elongation factor TFIIS
MPKAKQLNMDPDRYNEICRLMGKEEADDFLAKFGLGPKYVPQEPNKHKCPGCGKVTAYYKEIHPDTDMNEIVLYCPECGYEEEE